MAASHSSWKRRLVLNDTVDEVEDDDDTDSDRDRGGPIGFHAAADDEDDFSGGASAPFGTAPRASGPEAETEATLRDGGDATRVEAAMEEEEVDDSRLSSAPTEMTRVSGSSATTTVVDGATTTAGIDAEIATAATEEDDAAGDAASAMTVDETDEANDAASAASTAEEEEEEEMASSVAAEGEAASGCDRVGAGPSSVVMVRSTIVIRRSLATG